MARIYRQGDVILKEIDEIRGEKTDDALVIQSETGHPHVLKAPVFRRWGQTQVLLEEPTQIQHPQHRPITLPAGKYQVYTVRDFRGRGMD